MIKEKTLHIKFIFKIYLNIYKTSKKYFRFRTYFCFTKHCTQIFRNYTSKTEHYLLSLSLLISKHRFCQWIYMMHAFLVTSLFTSSTNFYR